MVWVVTLMLAGALDGSPSSPSNTPLALATREVTGIAEKLLAAETRRLRTTAPRVGALIAEGVRRSPTFAALVADLHRTNVIVYVETSMRLPEHVAGRLLFASAAGDQRYLRVQVRPTLTRDAMIAVIAHELRHALEVAEEHSVVTERTLEDFYRRVGDLPHAAGGYDTEAARAAQRSVHNELTG